MDEDVRIYSDAANRNAADEIFQEGNMAKNINLYLLLRQSVSAGRPGGRPALPLARGAVGRAGGLTRLGAMGRDALGPRGRGYVFGFRRARLQARRGGG